MGGVTVRDVDVSLALPVLLFFFFPFRGVVLGCPVVLAMFDTSWLMMLMEGFGGVMRCWPLSTLRSMV